MKINQLLCAIVLNTFLPLTMLHASDISKSIPEFDCLKGKTENEIFTALNRNPDRTQSCIYYLKTKRLEEEKRTLQEENELLEDVIYKVDQENLQFRKYEIERKLSPDQREEKGIKEVSPPEKRLRLSEDDNLFKQVKACKRLKVDNDSQYKSINTLLKNFNASPVLNRSFFKNFDSYSQINRAGDKVQNQVIWQELLKKKDSLFSDLLKEERKIQYLEKELFDISTNINVFNQFLVYVNEQLERLNISSETIREISDANFAIVNKLINDAENLRQIISKMKKEKLNIDSVLLETLNKKFLNGVNLSGKKIQCRFDKDFFKKFPYFNPNYQDIRSVDTLFKLFIDPARDSEYETINIVNDAYVYIFQKLFPDLNFDQVHSASDEESLNYKLLSKILLYNLQTSALVACKVWNEYPGFNPDFWHIPTFTYNADNAVVNLQSAKNCIDMVYKSYQLKNEDLIKQLSSPSVFEFIQRSNLALKQFILEKLEKGISALNEEIEHLRKASTFQFHYSAQHILQEQVRQNWLLDQVIDKDIIPAQYEIIPENLTIS